MIYNPKAIDFKKYQGIKEWERKEENLTMQMELTAKLER